MTEKVEEKGQKVLFELEQGKPKLRLNGHSTHTFKFNSELNYVIPVSSEFARKQKIFVYPDVILEGEAEITIINLSPYFVDLYRKDHIVDLKQIIG